MPRSPKGVVPLDDLRAIALGLPSRVVVHITERKVDYFNVAGAIIASAFVAALVAFAVAIVIICGPLIGFATLVYIVCNKN